MWNCLLLSGISTFSKAFIISAFIIISSKSMSIFAYCHFLFSSNVKRTRFPWNVWYDPFVASYTQSCVHVAVTTVRNTVLRIFHCEYSQLATYVYATISRIGPLLPCINSCLLNGISWPRNNGKTPTIFHRQNIRRSKGILRRGSQNSQTRHSFQTNNFLHW